jgi:hypothetical protein
MFYTSSAYFHTWRGALWGVAVGLIAGLLFRRRFEQAEDVALLISLATGAIVGAVSGAAQVIVDAVRGLERSQARRPSPDTARPELARFPGTREYPMTKTDFLDSLAWQLTLRGVPYDRPDLEAFVAEAWPLLEEDPDPGRWAWEYAEAHAGAQAPG